MVCKDKDGNYVIKLIDLDFVKKSDYCLLEIKNEFDKNRLGTEGFMAPELFLGKPY
jgi:hypothetical protein